MYFDIVSFAYTQYFITEQAERLSISLVDSKLILPFFKDSPTFTANAAVLLVCMCSFISIFLTYFFPLITNLSILIVNWLNTAHVWKQYMIAKIILCDQKKTFLTFFCLKQ